MSPLSHVNQQGSMYFHAVAQPNQLSVQPGSCRWVLRLVRVPNLADAEVMAKHGELNAGETDVARKSRRSRRRWRDELLAGRQHPRHIEEVPQSHIFRVLTFLIFFWV